jgi:hypothetical protein
MVVGLGFGKRLSLSILRAVFLVLLLSPRALHAEAVQVKEYGYSLDLPEGWKPVDASDPAKLSFTDPSSGAMLEVAVFSHERLMSASDMEADIRKKLRAEGSPAVFSFSGREACRSEIAFASGGRPMQGFVLVVKGLSLETLVPVEDAMLVGFSPKEKYGAARDSILSALDSFSPDKAGRLLPGPIGQLAAPFPPRDPRPSSVKFLGQAVRDGLGPEDARAAQSLVEREARILAREKNGQISAWRRYYRMIYRDSYHRLDGIVEGMKAVLSARAVQEKDIPAVFLSWIQDFSYQRTGTLADFLSPLSVAISASGDCDSRALFYAEILRHFGLDAIVLVSPYYAHAMAGIALDRDGAAFTFDGKKYLVAEMTEKVDMGLIAKSMADPNAWYPMPLE